jgi:hypothetical protein
MGLQACVTEWGLRIHLRCGLTYGHFVERSTAALIDYVGAIALDQ